MAFGVASISRDGAVTYANLWLPKRWWTYFKWFQSNIMCIGSGSGCCVFICFRQWFFPQCSSFGGWLRYATHVWLCKIVTDWHAAPPPHQLSRWVGSTKRGFFERTSFFANNPDLVMINRTTRHDAKKTVHVIANYYLMALLCVKGGGLQSGVQWVPPILDKIWKIVIVDYFREAAKYYLADFFRLGGDPPFPLRVFRQNDFPVRG